MSSHENPVTRREWLRTASLATLASVSPGASLAAPAQAKTRLHRYPDYGWLRGFSMVPSWAARIEEAWGNYHPDRMREEVALARVVHANGIRLWMEFTAWMADPDKVTANFHDAVAAIAEAGMKVMPCLFNRWHDAAWDYGGTYHENLGRGLDRHLEYVRALVAPLAQDERVFVWDLCNEPQARDLQSELNKKEYAWMEAVAKEVRACGALQPVTIGTMTGSNIEVFAPLVDVLCAHPYARDRAGLLGQIDAFKSLQSRAGKPLLVNECIPGSLDDAVRGGVLRYYDELLSGAGFGWMGWALKEGKAVAARKDRPDGNGINGEGYHPYFTKEGRLRGGQEFLLQKPKRLAPWENA